MSKAIKLLDEAITVLETAKQNENNKLMMDFWVDDPGNAEVGDDKHFCGTAACVCGYMAIERTIKQHLKGTPLKILSYNEVACDISVDFAMFLPEDVGRAIWKADQEDRYWFAERSEFFTEEELKHPHLTVNNSSLTNALDFVKLVKSKIEEGESDV